MIRPFVGLAVTCFLVGCGTSAPETTTTAGGGAPVEDVARATEAKAEVAVKTSAEANTSTHTVAFKVPGMT